MSLKNNTIVFSIIPDIKNGEGHMLPYQKFFTDVLTLINVSYRVNYYSESKNFNYKNWSNNIYMGRITPYKVANFSLRYFFDFLKLTRSIKNALLFKEKASYKQKFVFIESFGIIELLAFTFAIIFSKNFIPIILFRHYPKGILKKLIFKFSVFLLDISNIKPIFMSDSSKLSLELGSYLNKNITTMPIPLNIDLSNKVNVKINKKNINIWWPGPPRHEKGLDEVVRFCTNLKTNDKFNFYTSSETNGLRRQKNIILLPSMLKKIDYYNLFNLVNIIYLPYSKDQYSHSTSNIFVESILHEKLTIVSSGTWMSDELSRFGLKNLVINNCSSSDLKKKFENEASNKSNYKKLRSMKLFYLKFHSVNNYATKLKEIINA
jgi:hypothetical protein